MLLRLLCAALLLLLLCVLAGPLSVCVHGQTEGARLVVSAGEAGVGPPSPAAGEAAPVPVAAQAQAGALAPADANAPADALSPADAHTLQEQAPAATPAAPTSVSPAAATEGQVAEAEPPAPAAVSPAPPASEVQPTEPTPSAAGNDAAIAAAADAARTAEEQQRRVHQELARHAGHAHGGPLARPPLGQRTGHEGHAHRTDPKTTYIQHGGHQHTVEDAEKHGGLILGTTLVVMLLAQAGLFAWKQLHPSSFDKATVLALWAFPAAYSAWHGVLEYWKMLTLWSLFTVICVGVLQRALSKPVARTTPRLVYTFFYWLYHVSYSTAIAGYAVLMLHFVGLSGVPLLPSPGSATLLLFYGAYFGVLGRDLAAVCSQSMAISMGYVAKKGEIPRKAVPPNTCALCDSELVHSFRPVAGAPAPPPEEHVHQLSCSHQYHDFCLRGWTLIGKRDTCPSCHEKVKLQGTLTAPWSKPSAAWSGLLDCLRYLIVFNPIVVVAAQAVLFLVY